MRDLCVLTIKKTCSRSLSVLGIFLASSRTRQEHDLDVHFQVGIVVLSFVTLAENVSLLG